MAKIKLALGQLLCFFCLILVTGCDEHAWNDPYPNEPADGNILFSAFSEQPKHLDPARSYSANEWAIIGDIYEPPLEYHYLLRPYQLQPLIAENMPQVSYDPATDQSTYRIKIKPGIMYQPHPALAKKPNNEFYYHNLSLEQAQEYNNLNDFEHTGSREVNAADYVMQIKRLADPKVNSPIFGLLSTYIIDFQELRERLAAVYTKNSNQLEIDNRSIAFAGATVIDDYTYEIKLHGKYPQFNYWLAMPFFAPIPWEAIKFYSQPGLLEHNISLDWYPIGTGAYYLTENNPERRMVLTQNPNFHPDYYPATGEPSDLEDGLLELAGQKLPFIERVIFSLEKESIPYWDKFLQGYYDNSGISSDNFNSAISTASSQTIELSSAMRAKQIQLEISDTPAIFYWAFNMLDDTVGGYSEAAKKLRQAISLAFDMPEYIAIFTNGRGLAANGPIPPGILGYNLEHAQSIGDRLIRAKMLLADAGYPDGRNAQTGEPLQIYFEAIGSGDPDEKARLAWIRKQLAKLGIDLIIRTTDYNRFMDKMQNGDAQMFAWGWNADYPDPENFLFLFYGPNGKVKYQGENAANYNNPEFDKLFLKFKSMGTNPARVTIIAEMLAVLREDLPWIWGYYPRAYGLHHGWQNKTKPSGVANNTLKYVKIKSELRAQQRMLWNKPVLWPFALGIILIIVIISPAIMAYRRSEKSTAKRQK